MTAFPREIARIDRIRRGAPRSSRQRNAPHESDAELLALPGTDAVLAVSVDAIVEEIESGLYREPELAARVAVVAAASDLAAVGAEPLGVLVSVTLPPCAAETCELELNRGLLEGCRATGLPLLGGDLNFGRSLAIGVTALGFVPGGPLLTRCGCRPGDLLFASGPLGLGAAFALAALDLGVLGAREADPKIDFRPTPRLRLGAGLRGIASCCIDTSDGLLPALDDLGLRNRVGFELEGPVHRFLHPEARSAVDRIPAWTLLAGPHGEFELVFTVPPGREPDLLAFGKAVAWTPLRLGRVSTAPGVRVRGNGEGDGLELPAARVRDLFEECGQDPGAYLQTLVSLDVALRD